MKRTRRTSIISLFLVLAFWPLVECRPAEPPEPSAVPVQPWKSEELKIVINKRRSIEVTVLTPEEVPLKAEVLVLPGWKHERQRWLVKTKILEYARKHGFRLILPEMHVSIYASEYFPETKRKWAPVPGLVFITDYLFPQLSEAGFFTGFHEPEPAPGATPKTEGGSQKKLPRLLLGLSTGGRGVLRIGLARPGMFQAAAAFSGDYDQTRQPKDRLMTAVYGPYEDFEDRWARVDNVIHDIEDWSIPLYIAHGTKDKVVPVGESRDLYKTLQTVHPRLKVELETPAMGHDYPFWDEYTRRAFLFFDRVLFPETSSQKSPTEG